MVLLLIFLKGSCLVLFLAFGFLLIEYLTLSLSSGFQTDCFAVWMCTLESTQLTCCSHDYSKPSHSWSWSLIVEIDSDPLLSIYYAYYGPMSLRASQSISVLVNECMSNDIYLQGVNPIQSVHPPYIIELRYAAGFWQCLYIQSKARKMSYSFLLKYIIIGDSGVGKSCLLLQYTDRRYREKHEVTIGVEFGAKTIQVAKNAIKLQIWDTAGQECFKAITRGYYKNAIGAVVCYDISNKESFNHVARWLQEAQINGSAGLNFILVGNKSDKQAERKISYEEGLRFAKQRQIAFVQTSAKTGLNVEQIFKMLTESILQKIEKNQIELKDHPGIKIGTEKYIPSRESFIQTRRQEVNVKIQNDPTLKDAKRGCCAGSK